MQMRFLILLLIYAILLLAMGVQAENDISNFEEALTLSQQGNYEEALNAIDKQIQINEGATIAWTLKALILYKLDKYDEAKVAIENQQRLDQYEAKTILGITDQIAVYGKQNFGLSDAESQDFYNQMLKQFGVSSDSSESINQDNVQQSEVTPDSSESANLGDFQQVSEINVADLELKDYVPAITYPEDQEMADYIRKGNRLQAQGRIEEALQAFSTALGYDNNNVAALNNKGTALIELGKFDLAIEAFDEAIANVPAYEAAIFNKGIVLKFQGKYDEAIDAFNQVLEIKPNNAKAKKELEDAKSKRDAKNSPETETPVTPEAPVTPITQEIPVTPVTPKVSQPSNEDSCCAQLKGPAENFDYARCHDTMSVANCQ